MRANGRASVSAAEYVTGEECGVFRSTAELAGKKWNAAIMLSLARGAYQFSSIRSDVAGISDRLLSMRLRELERHDLITRTVIPDVPVQIHYELTSAGRELITILCPLVQWAHRWGQHTPADGGTSVQTEPSGTV